MKTDSAFVIKESTGLTKTGMSTVLVTSSLPIPSWPRNWVHSPSLATAPLLNDSACKAPTSLSKSFFTTICSGEQVMGKTGLRLDTVGAKLGMADENILGEADGVSEAQV